ncbi:MAG: DUF4258 domain-containing protein [Candidatus Zixiibacteriota bacterium]
MIKLTRHAKNNVKLYEIGLEDIEEVLEKAKIRDTEEDRHIAIKRIKRKFGNLPLKVVYMIENDDKIIITAYPLKKTFKRR